MTVNLTYFGTTVQLFRVWCATSRRYRSWRRRRWRTSSTWSRPTPASSTEICGGKTSTDNEFSPKIFSRHWSIRIFSVNSHWRLNKPQLNQPISTEPTTYPYPERPLVDKKAFWRKAQQFSKRLSMPRVVSYSKTWSLLGQSQIKSRQ